MGHLPSNKPKLSERNLLERIAFMNVDRNLYPVVVIGIRGYYKDTMGIPGKNDRGIYDDAIFINSPSMNTSFNANTDPSVTRPGLAVLVPNRVYLYKIGMHNMKAPYEALRQYGRVTVIRDGSTKEVTDTAAAPFWIDIHKGRYNSTSSIGCHTIYPVQWLSFLESVKSEIKRYKQTIIPYILIEN